MTDDDLANDMASLPEQRLPIELVSHISSFLANTSSLRALARLNQASNSVQQETIKQLYQTLVYKSTPSWSRSVAYDIPKGWVHTRNLLLSDTTHALLEQHLGFMAHHKILDSSAVTADKTLINQAFPKLELLAITDALGFTRLKIYKPMSLAGIMERLDVDRHKEQSFYGTIWNRKEQAPSTCCLNCRRSAPVEMETIVELSLKTGAYLLRSDDSNESGAGFYAAEPGKLPEFCFKAHGTPPGDHLQATSGIKQFLRCYHRAQKHRPVAAEMMLRVVISSEWFEVFVNSFASMQKLICNITVGLTTVCNYDYFLETFGHLVESYLDGWSRQGQKSLQKHFAVVFAQRTISPASTDVVTAANSRSDFPGHGRTHERIALVGELDLGHWGVEDDTGNAPWVDRGFTASIHRMVQVDPLVLPRSELVMHTTYVLDEEDEAGE